jgi:hypothetical protein
MWSFGVYVLRNTALQEGCFAVACAVYGRTDPALVALLPQEELIAEEVGSGYSSCSCRYTVELAAGLCQASAHCFMHTFSAVGLSDHDSKHVMLRQLRCCVTIRHVTQDTGVPYQFVPPGFQMITLPYSDDIRLPEREPGFTGTEHIFANDAQARRYSIINTSWLVRLAQFDGCQGLM